MEALLALGLIFAFTIGAVAFVVLVMLLVRRADEERRARFARAVSALGLTPSGTLEAHAVRDGVTVRVSLTTEQRGSGKHRRRVRVTRYFAYPDPPLRMGLELSQQTPVLGDLLDLFGVSQDIVIGDPALDAALRIKAREPDHAQALLRDPAVGPPLLEACRVGRFTLSDGQAFLQHDGWALDAGSIGARLDCLHRTMHALIAARRRWRASWEPALDASWGAIAATEGMTYDPSRSQLHGRVPGAEVRLGVTTFRGALITRAELRFDPPLGIGLVVVRTGLAQNIGKLLGGQDVQVGVPAFDALFTVKARDEAAARQALGGDAGHTLAQLAQVAREIEVDDERIRMQLDGPLHDARGVGSLVRALLDGARAMRGGGAVMAGAYR